MPQSYPTQPLDSSKAINGLPTLNVIPEAVYFQSGAAFMRKAP
ncbi:hypothetical protein AA0112_g245 [Alternaria arborescens]|nr:hypothetical protein AA0112_g245 [Alternaria arborescens]